jgi:hypothetical protein
VLCHSKREAEAALASLRLIVAELGLELKQAKTRIVHLREGGEGLDFLGFHHRRVRGERRHRHLRFLARWPSREAMQRARDRIREITDSKRLRDPVEVIVREINRFLRGWANYFRYGNSRLHFTRITTYALRRLALFVAKRHKRATGYGMTVVAYVSPNRMGLVNLDRLVVTPSPFSGTGGPSRIPPVKDVGEPCAGECAADDPQLAGGSPARAIARSAR